MPATATLRTLIETEIQLFHAFVQTLKNEARILAEHGDDHALAENTLCKTRQAEQMASLAQRRLDALAALGYPQDHAGLEAAVRAHNELGELYAELSRLAAQAHALNSANGITLDVFIQHNQRALNELEKLAGDGRLYDVSGRYTRRSHRTRPRVRAG